jgi:hypothetical protein
MKYLMFVATDTEPDTEPAAAPDIEAWFEDVDSRGKWVVEPDAGGCVRYLDGTEAQDGNAARSAGPDAAAGSAAGDRGRGSAGGLAPPADAASSSADELWCPRVCSPA